MPERRGQRPYFALSRRKTTTTKVLTYFSNFNGSPVIIRECTVTFDQHWNFNGSAITLFDGSMCLDLTNGDNFNGAGLQIWECSATNPNQQWSLSSYTPDTNTTGAWAPAGQKRCLDLTNGNFTNGNRVQIWDCSKCVEAFKARENQSTCLFITPLL